MDMQKRKILENRINVFGILGQKEEAELAKFIMDNINMHFSNAKPTIFKDAKSLENDLFSVLRKLLFKRFKKYPAILVNVLIDGEVRQKMTQNAPHKGHDMLDTHLESIVSETTNENEGNL